MIGWLKKSPILNTKIKGNFDFNENLFPFTKFEIKENGIYFNITKIYYSFSYQFGIIKIEY